MKKTSTLEIVGGTADGLTATFLKYRTLLRATVGKIVRPQDIEDIVQETFVRAIGASRRTQMRHPRAYMLRIATNLALKHVSRADQRLTCHIEDISSVEVYLKTATLESQVEESERFFAFCRAVRKLPIQCRRAFLLRKVYGLTQKEISEYLGISQSTVEKHVAKGMMGCTEYMTRMGYPIIKRGYRPAPRLEKEESTS